MTPSNPDNLIGQLAEEWRERLRKGERPELDEYLARYPDLADEIRDLFPAIALMEELKPATVDSSSASGRDGLAAGGQTLERLGDYRILREVGRGGMGIVYEAEQESLGRRVALKVLPSQALLDPDKKKRFQREAKATARLHHTNIVPVYGVGEHDGLCYYVMQFIQGLGLDEVLVELKRLRKARSSGKLSPAPLSPPESAGAARDISVADVARSLLTGQAAPGGGRAPEGEGEAPAEPSVCGSAGASPSRGGPEDVTAPPRGHGPGVATASFKPRLASSSGVSRDPPSGSASSTSEVHLPGQEGQAALSESGRHYWQSVARIGIQVAEALDHANGQGIVHRDIKPSNLLLDTQGTVWVTDFGLAKLTADGEDLTGTGEIVGTLRYMPPERFNGQADARGDIYSLGLTLYELLTFRPAFDQADRQSLICQIVADDPPAPRRINPAIPRDLETIVLKAIARDPAHRYPTAAELAEDLKRFVEDRPIRARRASLRERLWRWGRRNPALATATALAAAALVAVTVLSVTFNISQARARADLSRAFDDLSAEQERTQTARRRTQDALAKSERLADTLAAEQRRTEQALTRTRRLSVKLVLERGQALIERRASALGMLWLARGLEMAPAGADDLRRIARTNLAGLRSELPVLRTVLYHPGSVYATAFSPDGKTLLSGGWDSTARLWDLATGRPIGTPLRHPMGVVAVAFSPDYSCQRMGELRERMEGVGASRLPGLPVGNESKQPARPRTPAVTPPAPGLRPLRGGTFHRLSTAGGVAGDDRPGQPLGGREQATTGAPKNHAEPRRRYPPGRVGYRPARPSGGPINLAAR
jgi:serine/threonine protein kinase